MKNLFCLIAFIGVLSVNSMAQSAYLMSYNAQIAPGGPATIEFWFGESGTIDTVDFTVKDKSTGITEHYQAVTFIPHRFEVFPQETTTYRLIYARNRYGEIAIDPNRCEVTIYVESNGVILYFNPPDMCENGEDVDLERYFSSNVCGNTWFEGNGVINTHFFRPSLVGPGTENLTAHIYYNGTDYSISSNCVVHDMPEVNIYGIPHYDIFDNSAPFVLNGSPSGGQFFGTGVIGNTFNPVIAGVGEHYVYYTYATENGCQETVWRIITVKHFGTGVDENETDSIVCVYPNPSDGLLSFSVPCIVEIYNVNGVRVKTHNDMVKELDISDLPANIYVLNLHMDDGTSRIVRIVKKD